MNSQHLSFAESIMSQFEAKLDQDFMVTPCAAIDKFTDSILYRLEGSAPKLGQCDYSDDFGCCGASATIHHLASEAEYCERHYLALALRQDLEAL